MKAYKTEAAKKRRTEEGRAKWATTMRKQRRRIKVLVLRMYGGKCKCCREQEILFLTVDHVKGGGTKHTKSFRSHAEYYKWLSAKKRPGFQVLCFQCNCGRAQNGGVCPHKKPGGTVEGYK